MKKTGQATDEAPVSCTSNSEGLDKVEIH